MLMTTLGRLPAAVAHGRWLKTNGHIRLEARLSITTIE